jgi:hypothetical protein
MVFPQQSLLLLGLLVVEDEPGMFAESLKCGSNVRCWGDGSMRGKYHRFVDMSRLNKHLVRPSHKDVGMDLKIKRLMQELELI